jgi:predicted O-methyltransferase YrrM
MAAALGCPEPDFARYLKEFEENANEAHWDLASLRFPYTYRSALNTQRVLYSLVRAHRPSLALETGVADGFSSFAILSALEANGGGHLHSIDIRSDVGALVPRQLEGRWTLHVIDDQRSAKKTLSTIPGIDFYYHDSGHNYLWQAFEYATVVRKMTGGGVFLSDDVDWSYAFIDHCETRRQKPTLMLEKLKVIGGYIVSA